MPAEFFPTSADLIRFLPETVLTVTGALLMVVDALAGRRWPHLYGHISLLGLAGASAAAVAAYGTPGPAFSGMLMADGFAAFFRVFVIGVGALTVLASYRYLCRENADTGEYHALILFSVAGQCVMVTANELIMIFIGLEISSIASYVLAGYFRDDKRNNEASLKYFLLGSFATAFLLYGIAWIFGLTGTTNLTAIRAVLAARGPVPSPVLVGFSAALMFVGLGFKVSGAPFQIWAPDVYQGAPTPISAFLSAGPKAAAFAVLLRIFTTAFGPIGAGWEPLIWLSALLSMTIGNFAALTQSNIKRLLAYSSIAHAGYVLVAVAARSETGTAAAMFYLAAYALMNIGAFAVVSHISGKGDRFVSVDDFSGLAARQPFTAALLAIFLLSLIGVPLTGGFFGKFYIFKAALQSNLVWLTVLGLLNSAVAAYYYLRILVVMYMQEPSEAVTAAEPLTVGMKAALVLPALGTFFLGIFPSTVLDLAGKSAALVK
jgi:NADH-quinone oxidoreductase subunit N